MLLNNWHIAKHFHFVILQVFLNLTKDEQTELSEEVPACIPENDEMNADNFTEKDGINLSVTPVGVSLIPVREGVGQRKCQLNHMAHYAGGTCIPLE